MDARRTLAERQVRAAAARMIKPREIDPGGEDGPLCIEYESVREVLLERADSVLGAVLRRCRR